MNESSESPVEGQPDTTERPSATPPSRRAGTQLYLVPPLIVVLFVAGWTFVYWLLHENQDPHSLVGGMQAPGRQSWQRAYALSQLLHDRDHDALKDDAQLCDALTRILAQQNRVAAVGRAAAEDEQHARYRAFLCRALGEFRLQNALPVLLDTVELNGSQHSTAVRQAAIEAIAVLSGNIGPANIRSDDRVISVLVSTTHEAGSREEESDLVSAATFALGILGGPRAIERLIPLLNDARVDVRYNAATGLARHHNPEAIEVLLEMLDPGNHVALVSEKTESARQRKRMAVLGTAIRAAEQIAVALPVSSRGQLVKALQVLSDAAEIPHRTRLEAREALLKLQRQR